MISGWRRPSITTAASPSRLVSTITSDTLYGPLTGFPNTGLYRRQSPLWLATRFAYFQPLINVTCGKASLPASSRHSLLPSLSLCPQSSCSWALQLFSSYRSSVLDSPALVVLMSSSSRHSIFPYPCLPFLKFSSMSYHPNALFSPCLPVSKSSSLSYHPNILLLLLCLPVPKFSSLSYHPSGHFPPYLPIPEFS